MQVLSSNTVTASGSGGIYGTNSSTDQHSKLMKRNFTVSTFVRKCLWNQCMQSSFSSGNLNVQRASKYKAKAGWLFKGGDKGLDASSERSESANEDLLIFFFQLDLATRVQYALNVEQYEIAKQLRNKLNEVEAEVIKLQDSKRGSTSKSEAQDKAISLIRLRADLQKAIEGEDYASAAKLRDEISNMEAESLAASAKALAFEKAEYAFRLGQKVRHKVFGYRAVICGMDPVCCESSEWMETAQVDKLSQGSSQPFYQALVDVHDDPNLVVTYVAEENLVAPEQPDLRRFDHPYIPILFYGTDSAGDFIPIKQLREKYNRPRHEVPIDPQDQEGDDSN
ncbi:hypothetical protein SAY86_020069 [Trapa natans]|uniref:Hemimethylated DNA-binding domain-containing protein n=1 Tax=Trapa natans TaxID=22666 RepID=A0AAN7R588_TRANT|nr:hypothetical protein SAY86_020069 [Trapa natans]